MSCESSNIEKVVIYPAIGFARVGNSPNEYFIGPEVPGQQHFNPSDYRDGQGRIKRQAALFRIFGVNKNGEIVKEINASNAQITWNVQVANKKSAWYDFDLALDIPAARGDLPGIPMMVGSLKRNANYTGKDRQNLIIRPGARSISGKNVNKDGCLDKYAFNTGKFFGKSVYLGELRTDEMGNLIFLGGRGQSAPIDHEPLTTFGNNDGWHDDISDGPVDATVVMDGKTYTAEGAWVVVGPPDYAPGIHAVVTGYDLLFEMGTLLDPSLKPKRPTFSEHIYPILKRMSEHQWVNAGFALDFGWGSPLNFEDPELIKRLNDPGEASRALRQSIFDQFRNPTYPYLQADSWPAYYGDNMTLDPASTDPRAWMAILDIQYEWLGEWAKGNFDADGAPKPKTWAEMTPAERAEGMTRAALEETVAGPFHPGTEFTWPMRQPILYSAPFRIKRRSDEKMDYGKKLTSQKALAEGGPLDGSTPGDVTRWMAVPWQTDTSSCLSAYNTFYGEYLPTFWPARVPNDVLTAENYQILMDPNRPLEDKEKAFDPRSRAKWLRGIRYTDSTPPKRITTTLPLQEFVKEWSKVGIIVEKPGPKDAVEFPDTVWVETGRELGCGCDSKKTGAGQS